MRILYVAKHDQPNTADDEGAIMHALRELGHDVQPLREVRGSLVPKVEADLLLSHCWHDAGLADRAKVKARVFWYFDLVDWPADPTLAKRCAARVAWVRDATRRYDLGFCTDGDWVANDKSGKLTWLPQGADERVVGFGEAVEHRCEHCGQSVGEPDILFTGIGRGGGQQRESFVADMRARWGNRFRHIERGVHGRQLADLIASVKVVVAPDSPVTDRYWSNRAWNALGFGACLLHPWSEGLSRMYENCAEIELYTNREDMNNRLARILSAPDYRRVLGSNGLERTKREHLYRHRCERLIQVVKERLF